jgi:hypothetical protein
VATKYTSIFHSNALQNLPKLVFLVLKYYTTWQPCLGSDPGIFRFSFIFSSLNRRPPPSRFFLLLFSHAAIPAVQLDLLRRDAGRHAFGRQSRRGVTETRRCDVGVDVVVRSSPVKYGAKPIKLKLY